jgi:hypothetical protein
MRPRYRLHDTDMEFPREFRRFTSMAFFFWLCDVKYIPPQRSCIDGRRIPVARCAVRAAEAVKVHELLLFHPFALRL